MIQQDEHLEWVLRYWSETRSANAVNARGMEMEQFIRAGARSALRELISDCRSSDANWIERVKPSADDQELEAIRTSTKRGQPLGVNRGWKDGRKA